MQGSRLTILIVAIGLFMAVWLGMREAPPRIEDPSQSQIGFSKTGDVAALTVSPGASPEVEAMTEKQICVTAASLGKLPDLSVEDPKALISQMLADLAQVKRTTARSDEAGQEPKAVVLRVESSVATSRTWPSHKKYDLNSYLEAQVTNYLSTDAEFRFVSEPLAF